MKTLVLFYSYSGNTKRIAQDVVAGETTDVAEIKDVKRPGTLKAYTLGCIASMRGKGWEIQPLSINLSNYDQIFLFAPVWASNPPPAVFTLLNLLPEGKAVSVRMISASGVSGCKDRLSGIIQSKGCTLVDFADIKS